MNLKYHSNEILYSEDSAKSTANKKQFVHESWASITDLHSLYTSANHFTAIKTNRSDFSLAI